MRIEGQTNTNPIRETLDYWGRHPRDVIFRIAPAFVLFLAGCRGGRGQISNEELQATLSAGFAQATEVMKTAQVEATALVGEGQAEATRLARTPTPSKTPTPNATVVALQGTIASFQTQAAESLPTLTPITIKPVEVATQELGLTATPTEPVLRFFVLDDNSVTEEIREKTVALLKRLFPDAEVVGFETCTTELRDGQWSGGVADHTINGVQSAGPDCVKDILEENPGATIVGYTQGQREMNEMIRAGSVVVCWKPDSNCVIDALDESLNK